MLTGLAFTAFFFALLVLAFKRHPVFGLYAYLVAFYVHPPSRWWAQNLPDLRWALLAGMVTLAAVYVHREKLRKAPPWFGNVPAAILIGYCLWLWIQNFWALDPEAHYGASVQYTKYLIAFYLFYRILDTPERLRDFLLVHLAGCGYLGILAHFSTNYAGSRLNGVGGPGINDSNTLGMFLATGVVAGCALVLGQSGWRRYLSFAGLALAMNGLVLTASRGAFVGFVAGALSVSALHPRRFRMRLILLALVGIAGFLAVADQRFILRMFTLQAVVEKSEEMDGSAESRFAIKRAQYEMFLDYPLGAGHKGTAVLSPLYLDERYLTVSEEGGQLVRARSSHNTFFTTLSEQGFVGASLFAGLVLWVFISGFRIFRLARSSIDPERVTVMSGLCGGIVVVLIAGIGTDYLMAEVQFWFISALVVALQLAKRPVESAATDSRLDASARREQPGVSGVFDGGGRRA